MSTQLIKNIEEFKQILNELKQNPLFYAFGENKENFHSSFWKWMFHEDPKETIRILTGHIEEENDLKNASFKREQNSTNHSIKNDNESSHNIEPYKARYDVLININEKNRYIIETKVKSFPTIDQLERIELATKNENEVKFFCIHLYPSKIVENISSKLKNWKFFDFKTVAERIIIDEFKSSKQWYVSDYKNLLLSLNALFKLFSLDNEKPKYDFIWGIAKKQKSDFNLQAELEEYKLWELFLHFRSKHFFQKLKDSIEIKNEFKGKLVYECSINNKKSTISIGYILDGDNNLLNKYSLNFIDRKIKLINTNTKIVGIQIEDSQFRQFVLASKDSEGILKNMEEAGLFADCQKLQKEKLYCKYGETFKYRYSKIETDDFDEIYKMIIVFLTKIKEIQSELLIVK